MKKIKNNKPKTRSPSGKVEVAGKLRACEEKTCSWSQEQGQRGREEEGDEQEDKKVRRGW